MVEEWSRVWRVRTVHTKLYSTLKSLNSVSASTSTLSLIVGDHDLSHLVVTIDRQKHIPEIIRLVPEVVADRLAALRELDAQRPVRFGGFDVERFHRRVPLVAKRDQRSEEHTSELQS